jgi:hypothetical protein
MSFVPFAEAYLFHFETDTARLSLRCTEHAGCRGARPLQRDDPMFVDRAERARRL